MIDALKVKFGKGKKKTFRVFRDYIREHYTPIYSLYILEYDMGSFIIVNQKQVERIILVNDLPINIQQQFNKLWKQVITELEDIKNSELENKERMGKIRELIESNNESYIKDLLNWVEMNHYPIETLTIDSNNTLIYTLYQCPYRKSTQTKYGIPMSKIKLNSNNILYNEILKFYKAKIKEIVEPIKIEVKKTKENVAYKRYIKENKVEIRNKVLSHPTFSGWTYKHNEFCYDNNGYSFRVDYNINRLKLNEVCIFQESNSNDWNVLPECLINEKTLNKIINEFVKQTRHNGVKTSTNNCIDNKYIEIIESYNTNAILPLNKVKPITNKIQIILNEKNILTFVHPLFCIEIIDGKEKVTFKPIYQQMYDNLKSKNYQKCIKYYKQLIDTYELNLTIKDGDGLLFGNTILDIKNKYGTTTKMFNMPYYKDSITIWKKELLKNIKQVVEELKSNYDKRISELKEDYKEWLGLELVREIFRMVKLNESYITANVLTSCLKNHDDKGNRLKFTSLCGKFTLYTAKEIRDLIDTLTYHGVLHTQEIKGMYGWYDILKIGDNEDYTLFFDVENYNHKKVLNKIQNQIMLNDDEALEFFNNVKEKENKTINDYVSILFLVNSIGFLCFHQDELVALFELAPTEILTLVQMKRKMETRKYIKGIYTNIVNVIKNKQKIQKNIS